MLFNNDILTVSNGGILRNCLKSFKHKIKCHRILNVEPEKSQKYRLNQILFHFQKSEFMLNKLYEDKESFNESYSFTNMEQLRSQRGKIHHEKSDSNYTSGFDIIDFIDHSSSEKNLTEKSPIPYDKRIREVSPPKKPTLDTPTPPRFYRRKMYWYTYWYMLYFLSHKSFKLIWMYLDGSRCGLIFTTVVRILALWVEYRRTVVLRAQ